MSKNGSEFFSFQTSMLLLLQRLGLLLPKVQTKIFPLSKVNQAEISRSRNADDWPDKSLPDSFYDFYVYISERERQAAQCQLSFSSFNKNFFFLWKYTRALI